MSRNEIWMQGPYRVRRGVAEAIVRYLPDIHAQMKTQWRMKSADFPAVLEGDIAPYDPLVFRDEASAVVLVSVPSARDFQVTGYDDAIAEEFRVRYPIRVYVFTKIGISENGLLTAYQNSIRYRDMTATAVRAALLNRPSMGTPDLELIHSTMTEQYGESMKTSSGDRWAAPMFFEFDVLADENMVRPYLGISETISATAETIGTEEPFSP